MKYTLLCLSVSFSVVLSAIAPGQALAAPQRSRPRPTYTIPARPSTFTVFDAMAFTGQPNTASYGTQKIYLTGTEVFKRLDNGRYNTAEPDEAATRALANKVAALHQMLVIDIEHWPVDIRTTSTSTVLANMNKLGKIVEWIHNEQPDVKVGFYGIGPLRDYWAPVQYHLALQRTSEPWFRGNLPRFEANYKRWLEANAFLKPLIEKTDAVFPSVYTFYDDQEGWKLYASANLDQARIYGKPVYPFLWMYYHDSSKLKDQQLSADYWTTELTLVKQKADGVVIWGGWRQPWNPSAPWWLATQSFLMK